MQDPAWNVPQSKGATSKHMVTNRYGGLHIRVHHFKKNGDVHRGHLHRVDHITVVAKGRVQCRFGHDGEVREYTAPATIEIDKDVYHQFTALEDDTMYFCVFSDWGPADENGNPKQLDAMQLASIQAGICNTCSLTPDGCGSGVVGPQLDRVSA